MKSASNTFTWIVAFSLLCAGGCDAKTAALTEKKEQLLQRLSAIDSEVKSVLDYDFRKGTDEGMRRLKQANELNDQTFKIKIELEEVLSALGQSSLPQ